MNYTADTIHASRRLVSAGSPFLPLAVLTEADDSLLPPKVSLSLSRTHTAVPLALALAPELPRAAPYHRRPAQAPASSVYGYHGDDCTTSGAIFVRAAASSVSHRELSPLSNRPFVHVKHTTSLSAVFARK